MRLNPTNFCFPVFSSFSILLSSLSAQIHLIHFSLLTLSLSRFLFLFPLRGEMGEQKGGLEQDLSSGSTPPPLPPPPNEVLLLHCSRGRKRGEKREALSKIHGKILFSLSFSPFPAEVLFSNKCREVYKRGPLSLPRRGNLARLSSDVQGRHLSLFSPPLHIPKDWGRRERASYIKNFTGPVRIHPGQGARKEEKDIFHLCSSSPARLCGVESDDKEGGCLARSQFMCAPLGLIVPPCAFLFVIPLCLLLSASGKFSPSSLAWQVGQGEFLFLLLPRARQPISLLSSSSSSLSQSPLFVR